MANPQIDDGKYLKISNEIVDAFCRLKLSPNETQIIWTVLRKTYGWNKKEDNISLTQFQEITGLSRASVCRAIKSLVAKQLLEVVTKQLPANRYRLQKNWEEWSGSRYSDTSRYFETRVVAIPRPKVVAIPRHTKDSIKNTIQKTTISSTASRPINKRTKTQLLIDYYFELKSWDYRGKEKILYPRFIRTANEILQLCENDLDLAKKKIKHIELWANSQSIDWSLTTVLKRWFDIDQLPTQKKKRATIKGFPAYERAGRWYLIEANGEHKEWVGEKEAIIYE